MTGISIPERVVALFKELQIVDRQNVGKRQYILMKINRTQKPETLEIMESRKSSDDEEPHTQETLPKFISEKFPENECRYLVYDFPYVDANGMPNNRLILIKWAPDTAPIKDKMLIGGLFETLKRTLSGLRNHIQASDLTDVSWAEINNACK